MPDDLPIEKIQVSELRKSLKGRLAEKKPLIVMRNSGVVGVLLCVESSWYARFEHPRLEAKRLRAELEAAISQLLK